MKRGPGLHDERGGVVVIVVLTLVALIGMTVLTVDGGGLLSMRRHLVTASDSAALAAAIACALPGGDPAARADSVATANASYASRSAGPTVTPAGACGTKKAGQVAVTYQGTRTLTFAPVLGLPKTADVSAAATALWGPAGNGNAVPIMARAGWIKDCGIPEMPIGEECNLWFNNDDLGNSQSGWMNLDEWNVLPTAHCPNPGGANNRSEYIHNGYPTSLPLNDPPPTYTCAASGHASSNFSDFEDVIGEIKFLPVNDETQQLDKDGNVCPPPDCANPDKYAVIAFVPLEVTNVLHGNDPAAIGTQAAAGTCNPTHDFQSSGANQTWDLDTQSCPTSNLTYPADPSKPYPKLSKKRGSTTTLYVLNVDYQFDAGTNVITWTRNQNVTNVRVEWDWNTPASPGKCGVQASDSNAICLVMTWRGPQEGGGDPCPECPDFGLRAVRLSE
jgi:hypothetical protein